MKELKRLRVKFVLSNMVMVTLVIGLAFLGVGYFTKNQIDRDNEKMLGMAVEAEHAGSFLEWEGIARMPYFIVVTDGNNRDGTGGRPVWNGTGYRTGKISGSPEPVSTGSGGDIGKLSAPVSEDTGGEAVTVLLMEIPVWEKLICRECGKRWQWSEVLCGWLCS